MWHDKILFYPKLKIVNSYLKSLFEKENWETIKESFKKIERSSTAIKNEQSYLMGIYSAKELKDWRRAERFYLRGSQKMEFSEEFLGILDTLKQELPQEEKDKFIRNLNKASA